MKTFLQHKKVGRRLISLVILMGIYGYLVYQKENIDVAGTISVESLSAQEMLWRFQVNEGDDFLNQVVSVTGTVTAAGDSSLLLNNSIYCMMDTPVSGEGLNLEAVTIKGRCLGYYQPQKQVQLDHCIIEDH